MTNKVKCAIRTGSVLIKMGEEREEKKTLWLHTHAHMHTKSCQMVTSAEGDKMALLCSAVAL